MGKVVGDFRKTLTCNDIQNLNWVAAGLLDTWSEKRVFAFYGEMGAGKTTLIKALCQELGVTDNVSSPTFALVNVYNGEPGEVYHFDVYRMKTIEELFDIGYEDYFFSGNYCFIEWPEKIEALLPEDAVKVMIRVSEDDQTREISF